MLGEKKYPVYFGALHVGNPNEISLFSHAYRYFSKLYTHPNGKALMTRRALVCGASAGIGAATALALASQGCEIVALARGEANLTSLIDRLPTAAGQKHRFLALDVSDLSALERALTEHCAEFGGFDILINNSGGPPSGAILTATTAQFLAAFQQHLLAAHCLAQLLLPQMQAKGFGRIVNVISTSVKEPLKDLGVSNTVRAAVASWAKTLASEVAADGITVNNVLPGFTATARLQAIINRRMEKGAAQSEIEAALKSEVPARRFAQADEVAAAIAFLASDAAGYINGVNLPVDGGRTRSL